MTPIPDVEHFLREFKYKSGFYGVYIETTKLKNLQTIVELELNHKQMVQILDQIKTTDYCSGPKEDTNDVGGPPLWVFGCEVKGIEVYIKITMGSSNDRTICISFHKSERPLTYPYKT